MSTSLTLMQTNLINEIATHEGLEDFEIETKAGGEGSFGSIMAVTVKSKDKKLELILKSASTNDKVRTINPVRKAYLREIYVYEDLLPVYKAFQAELGEVDGFCAYPRIYGSIQEEHNECLVLENLNECGYKLWNRRIPMDSQHVALIFTEYAKFHAVSFAMRLKKPWIYSDLTKDLTNVFEKHSLIMAKTALEYGRKAVVGNVIANEALDRLSQFAEHFLVHELEKCGSKVVVIHKDGWCNNVMFKYEDQQDSEKPTKASIIDWQLAETGSPVLDLAYFFFTCGSTDVIINYPTYLRMYHDALTHSLGRMSCDVRAVYPFDLLVVHWQKYSKFGLFMALIMLKFMLSEKDEVASFSQMAMAGMSFVDRLNFVSVHDDVYNKRVSDIITVMAKRSLI